MPLVDGKVFALKTLADAAIATAELTWTPPTYVYVGPGPHATPAQIGTQRIAVAIEMQNGTYAVLNADHPTLKGTPVDTDLMAAAIRVLPTLGQALGAQAKGAGSGIVARPGAGEEQTG
jgi:hypothetical protein